jgi:hypothetical protein
MRQSELLGCNQSELRAQACSARHLCHCTNSYTHQAAFEQGIQSAFRVTAGLNQQITTKLNGEETNQTRTALRREAVGLELRLP